jgi:hypothetical protein
MNRTKSLTTWVSLFVSWTGAVPFHPGHGPRPHGQLSSSESEVDSAAHRWIRNEEPDRTPPSRTSRDVVNESYGSWKDDEPKTIRTRVKMIFHTTIDHQMWKSRERNFPAPPYEKSIPTRRRSVHQLQNRHRSTPTSVLRLLPPFSAWEILTYVRLPVFVIDSAILTCHVSEVFYYYSQCSLGVS